MPIVVTLPNASAIADGVLPVAGNTDARLYYKHFSIVMSKSRRLPLFTVVNIDGSASVLVSRTGDPWAFDGRIPRQPRPETNFTPTTTLIVATWFGARIQTEVQPPVSPTGTPSISPTAHRNGPFNERLWFSLEDCILSKIRHVGERATVFTGPFFRSADPIYRDVASPLAIGVVTFAHDDDRPSTSAYLIDHDVNLSERTLLWSVQDLPAFSPRD